MTNDQIIKELKQKSAGYGFIHDANIKAFDELILQKLQEAERRGIEKGQTVRPSPKHR